MEPIKKTKKKWTKTLQKMIVITMLFINCLIISCSFYTKKNTTTISNTKEIVTIYDYQIWLSDLDRKDLRDSTIYYIDTLTIYNRKNWIFLQLNDSLYTDPSYAIENDSLFLFGNIYCPNLDTIYLKHNNEMIELIVSHYDVEKSCDEEMYVYWNDVQGLVALYNYPWGALILFDRETMPGFAKETFYNGLISRSKEIKKVFIDGEEFQQFSY